ncbi:MAG: DUF2934 domain-containing protein [Candidatus Zixiibacteriota bacterium]
MKEINKKQWMRFLDDLSEGSRFARTEITGVDTDGSEMSLCSGSPLLGLALSRNKGKISDFEVRLGQIRDGSPVAWSLQLGMPVKMVYRKSGQDERDIIEIHGRDGRKLIIRIFSRTVAESFGSFVQEMAYSLAEARGFVPGHDQEDWYTAEQLVRKAALPGGKTVSS